MKRHPVYLYEDEEAKPSKIPDKRVLKLYRQLKWWKPMLMLSPGEIRTVRMIIESRYPAIQQEMKNWRSAQWGGIVVGIILSLGLVMLGLIVMILLSV